MSKQTAHKEAASVIRGQLARERRRRRALGVSIAAVSVLAVAGLIGLAIVALSGDDVTFPPGAAGDDKAGIATGTGPIQVDIYTDFLCPECGAYEGATKSRLDNLILENKITLIFHPVAFLDGSTSTEYSSRSSAASACAAEGGKFREYANALFANQPEEGGAGLDDSTLIEIGNQIGLTDPSFARCVEDGKYRPWTEHVTEKAGERGVSGTPTVYVDNQQIENSPDALTAAVTSAG